MISILECKQLKKHYRGGALALDNIDLQLPTGQIVGLLGPNGSGKTTLIKLACGLLTPSGGTLTIKGFAPGVESKQIVSYLPERETLPMWMKAKDTLAYYNDFFDNFNRNKALDMLSRLKIDPSMPLKAMSKGTREKLQLILAMSREADLYLLDEPIGGVDPAARDYILDTIINNYREEATVVISTHLIADVEKVLDSVVFIKQGRLELMARVDEIREQNGKSVDGLFREVFRC